MRSQQGQVEAHINLHPRLWRSTAVFELSCCLIYLLIPVSVEDHNKGHYQLILLYCLLHLGPTHTCYTGFLTLKVPYYATFIQYK